MLKQIIVLLVASVAIVVAMPYAHEGLNFLLAGYDWVQQILGEVFSGGQAGNIIKGLIALISIPVLVALVPTLLYWLARRSWFPYFMEIVWVIWLLQIGALIALYKAPVIS